MPEIRGSIDIFRPAEDVFAYLSEPKNSLEWDGGVVEMELTTDPPLRVGSKGRRVESRGGTDEGFWEVTEHVLNETLAMTFESGKFTGSGGYNLEPIDGGTRLEYWFMANPRKLLLKILIPLMKPMIHRQVRKDYAKLKSVLESRA